VLLIYFPADFAAEYNLQEYLRNFQWGHFMRIQ